MITGKQIKTIYSLASGIGINNNTHDDELHILIYSRTQKESVRDLTRSEASGIISELIHMKGAVKSIKYIDVPPGRMSKEQQDKAWRLIYKLCETDNSTASPGERMKGAVKKILDMDINMKNEAPFRMVTVRQGSMLIDNLKRYVSSAERKKRVNEMDIKSITIDHLYGEQYELADLIGIEAYKKLVMHYGGGSVYICKPDTIMKSDRNREICEKFNGYNYRELAKEYNLSKKTIRSITAVKLKNLKNAPIDGQLKL